MVQSVFLVLLEDDGQNLWNLRFGSPAEPAPDFMIEACSVQTHQPFAQPHDPTKHLTWSAYSDHDSSINVYNGTVGPKRMVNTLRLVCI